MKFFLIFVFIGITRSAPSALEKPNVYLNEINNEILVDKENDDVKTFRTKYAAEVKSFMNMSVDPCENFYEYSCGNWKNVATYRNTKFKRSNLEDIRFKLIALVTKLLEKSPNDFENYQNEIIVAKKFRESCMNTEIYPIKRVEEYVKVLQEIGGFPAIDDNWNADHFDWLNMTSYLSLYGVTGVVNEKIYPKHPFPPYFEVPKIGFDFQLTSENFKNENSDGYKINGETMMNLLNVYGVDKNKSEKIILDIFEFWRNFLALINEFNENSDCDSQEDLLMRVMNIDQFNWQRYYEISWQGANPVYDEAESQCPTFYNKLPEFMAKMKPEAIANYFSLKFLHMLHADFNATQYKSEYCTRRVGGSFQFLISRLYLQEYFNREIEMDIHEILSSLRESVRNLLSTTEWLDEETLIEALLKEEKFVTRIGSINDPFLDILIREINRLNISDNFYENSLLLAKFRQENKHYPYLQNTTKETKPLEMLSAIQVNAFYYAIDNSINVMAGLLHPPVYHRHFPNSVKYSTLGYILGHEMTHAFDHTGSHFDEEGQVRNWWTEESEAIFLNRSDCFENQYNGFKVLEIDTNIDGKTTQDENIADSGGLREAFNAYLNVLKKTKNYSEENLLKLNDDILPGLPLTNIQTFFLTFSQLYCANYTKETLWEEITNEHTVDSFRILGTLQNFAEFSKHFNCPVGSKMNPEKKCRVW